MTQLTSGHRFAVDGELPDRPLRPVKSGAGRLLLNPRMGRDSDGRVITSTDPLG
jgi:hypothetical protein